MVVVLTFLTLLYFYCYHAFIYLRSSIFSIVLQGLTEYHSLWSELPVKRLWIVIIIIIMIITDCLILILKVVRLIVTIISIIFYYYYYYYDIFISSKF